MADFNNDEQLDVFVSSYHASTTRDCNSFLYWNRKGSGFSAADCTRLFTHSASGCVAADFNEDGWVDLAIRQQPADLGDQLGYVATSDMSQNVVGRKSKGRHELRTKKVEQHATFV